MVLKYVNQHLSQKSPSYVGKYTSTMEHMGYVMMVNDESLFNPL